MKDYTKFVGLDVSKDSISVAVADTERGEPRFLGNIPHTPEAIRKCMRKLGTSEQLHVCYEAGPTGYALFRFLISIGIDCIVVAPTLIPKRAGDRVKTDRRDSLKLAKHLRFGELTPVWTPDEDHEALRDLVRARHDAKEDLHRARLRLVQFLLRHDLRSPKGTRNWSVKHRE
ncbi:IS110 family transposase [Paenibacillus sp. WC2504]|uniref:IS110 family transposase n=1 Tax=Paenibacillus sp. WC2504 TaxID=3461403 RepID=UPI004046415B